MYGVSTLVQTARAALVDFFQRLEVDLTGARSPGKLHVRISDQSAIDHLLLFASLLVSDGRRTVSVVVQVYAADTNPYDMPNEVMDVWFYADDGTRDSEVSIGPHLVYPFPATDTPEYVIDFRHAVVAAQAFISGNASFLISQLSST